MVITCVLECSCGHTLLPFPPYSELGAVPDVAVPSWKMAQRLSTIAMILQLVKFKVVFAYVRFKEEWYVYA